MKRTIVFFIICLMSGLVGIASFFADNLAIFTPSVLTSSTCIIYAFSVGKVSWINRQNSLVIPPRRFALFALIIAISQLALAYIHAIIHYGAHQSITIPYTILSGISVYAILLPIILLTNRREDNLYLPKQVIRLIVAILGFIGMCVYLFEAWNIKTYIFPVHTAACSVFFFSGIYGFACFILECIERWSARNEEKVTTILMLTGKYTCVKIAACIVIATTLTFEPLKQMFSTYIGWKTWYGTVSFISAYAIIYQITESFILTFRNSKKKSIMMITSIILTGIVTAVLAVKTGAIKYV